MRFLILALTTILFSIQLLAQNESTQKNQFEGTWNIDLRPTKNAEPYLKEFVVELDSNNIFHGKFYGSEFENGFINNNWEKLYFAFSTKDANNEYYHSGYLLDDKIYGVTYCPNRAFVAPWNGVKK